MARDLATISAREALLGEQEGTAHAQVRWRLGALYRLALVPSGEAPGTRARAVDAAAHALARAVAEGGALAAERTRARAERLALADAAPLPIGAAPAFAPPTPGVVLARFGVSPDRETGLLVSRAGARLAAARGQDVRAPAAGTVVSVAAEGAVSLVVIEHGAGWTSIVGGLATVAVAAGQPVAAGAQLGAAAGGPAGVNFEVWRGRRPVDPLLLVRRGPPRALAADASLH